MNTPLERVFRKFLSQIDDKEWLLEEDEVIEELMLEYLDSAIVEFYQCKKNIEIDYSNMEFNTELSNIEVSILAHAMVLHYLKSKIFTQDSLRQYVSDKDYNKLSGANMLLRLIGLEKAQRKQLESLQHKYVYKEFKGWD